MQYAIVGCLMGAVALGNAQQAQGLPPPVSTLSTTMSGVLPVIPTPTPFTGVPTIEGAITYDGPSNPGFTGLLGNATTQQNTPGLSFSATLPPLNFDPYTGSVITGIITGTVPANGTGVMITVNFTGFPSAAAYGPFAYHIHNMPVSANYNCTTALGHLDPTNRGEYYPCNPLQPQTCQVGDLAGKHGNITTASFSASYLDLYLSTNPASSYYFGNRSIVIHTANTTRLTCANFTSTVATNTTSAPNATSTLMPFRGAASQAGVGATVIGGALLSAALALFM